MRLLEHANAQVAFVAERWKRQYYRDGQWTNTYTGDSQAVYQKLVGAKTPADVAAAIGNDSWTGYTCHECGQRAEVAVRVGQDEDADRYADLCLTCVDRVSLYLRGVKDALGKAGVA